MKRALVLCVALAGCPKDEHVPAPGALASASAAAASSSAPAATSASAPTVPTAPLPPPPCRAIAVGGRVTAADGGASLSLGGPMADAAYALDDGAKMTVKDPASGREISFEGPGLVRACVAGDPEHWLLRGALGAVPGAGEKPGAEEWVVTPFGIVRFASAMLKVRVEKDRATVRVSNGVALVFGPRLAPAQDGGAPVPPDAGAGPEWAEALPATPWDLLSPGPPDALVDACAGAAKAARALGSQITQPGADLAALGPRHVEARRKARAACALARAAAQGAGKGLAARAEAADAEWRVVAR